MSVEILQEQETGGYFRALKENEYVTSSQDVPSKVIRDIHREQLQRAAATLEEQSVLDREFIAKTLTIPADRLPEIKRLIRESLEELATEIGQDKTSNDSTVAQLNVQFYLQTAKPNPL